MSAYFRAKQFLDEQGWSMRSHDSIEIVEDLIDEHAKLLASFRPNCSVDEAKLNMQIVQLEAEKLELIKTIRQTKSELYRANAKIKDLRGRLVLHDESQSGVVPSSGGGSGASLSSSTQMSKPGNSYPLPVDFNDPDFIPCRDERCPIDEVHAVHKVTGVGRGPRKPKRMQNA